ncbi:MAG: hypothetical protein RLZZ437_3555 [Pseudomonadota bacterium]
MFVFWLIKWVAFLGILFGLLRVAMGVYIVREFQTAEAIEWASRRYLGSKTTGEAIDQGIMWALTALVIWMIAKIGLHVTARANRG